MSESHVISALVAKRGELAGQAAQCQEQLRRLSEELVHVDATIRLFAPQYRVEAIRARRRRAHRWFAAGACQRWVLEILRDAPAPLSDAAVVAEVARRQQVPEGPEVLASVHKTTLAVLRRLGAQGIVRQGTAPTGARTWARS